jgi:spore germination protein KA
MRYISGKKKREPEKDTHVLSKEPLSADLEQNIESLKLLLYGCSDAVLKQFRFGLEPQTKGVMVYFDGLVNKSIVELSILKPLLIDLPKLGICIGDRKNIDSLLETIKESILTLAEVDTLSTFDELCVRVSSGDTVILIDGCDKALVAGTRCWEGRGVEVPDNETVIFGPKEGFSETLRFNTALLRRRLKSTNFKLEAFVIGRITKTNVVLGYIKGIASQDLVDEIINRLLAIDIDGLLDTAYLEEFITNEPKSIFSQVEHTEKPDHVCGQLLEGRLVIIVDGSPMAMVLPISFPQFSNSADDNYTHYIAASLFRLLRHTAHLIALLLPSLYVALITFHHEMIPTPLLLTIVASRQGVPFPAFIEALLMEFSFELLREAGLRLPRSIGPAVSIVGALIIGDAAVRAGLVSTPMVVVIAFTGIASFVTPHYNASITIRILRFIFLAAAASLGFLGIMIVFTFILTKMVSINSLGLPYMSPLGPLNLPQLSDILGRRAWYKNIYRPYLDNMENQKRQEAK